MISKDKLKMELKRFPGAPWASEAAALLEDYELRALEPTPYPAKTGSFVPSLRRRMEMSKLTGARLEGIRELIEALERLPADLCTSEFTFSDERHSIIDVQNECNDLIGCIVITKPSD